jgi:hypothetical protein
MFFTCVSFPDIYYFYICFTQLITVMFSIFIIYYISSLALGIYTSQINGVNGPNPVDPDYQPGPSSNTDSGSGSGSEVGEAQPNSQQAESEPGSEPGSGSDVSYDGASSEGEQLAAEQAAQEAIDRYAAAERAADAARRAADAAARAEEVRTNNERFLEETANLPSGTRVVWHGTFGVPAGWHTDDFVSDDSIISIIKD